MNEYKIGDELVIKLYENFGYKDVKDRYVKVQIIATSDEYGYKQFLCYVPHYITMKETRKASAAHNSKFKFDPIYSEEQTIIVTPFTIIHKHIPCRVGAKCQRCKQFVDYADNSQPFTCKSCRDNPWSLNFANSKCIPSGLLA